MKFIKIVAIAGLILLFLMVPNAIAQEDLTGTLERNNFTSTKWLNSTSNLILNLTTNRVHLNKTLQSEFGWSFENFTSYTEYEESGNLITVVNSTFVSARCDLQYARYLGYDFGTGYFENFTIRFSVYVEGIGGTGLVDNYYFHLNNLTSFGSRNDVSGAGGDDFLEFRILNDNTGDDYNFRFTSRTQDTDIIDSGSVEDNDLTQRWLYVEIFKDGNFVGVNVYNNNDFTDLRWNYNGTHVIAQPLNYRFMYPVQSNDLNLYPGYYIDVYVRNVDLATPLVRYSPSGNYFSTDLMVNQTGVDVYSILFEGLENIGTSIEYFVSEDQLNWVEILGNGQLLNGYNFNPLYIWVRLNSTDGLNTPYLDYYHIFYESSIVGADQNWGISLILLVLGFIIGLGVLRKDG